MSGDILIKFLVAAVLAGTPFLFGTVGEILSEKVGHLNLGVEGMMSLGACAGFMAGYLSDNFLVAILADLIGKKQGNIGVFMLERSEGGTLKLPETITAQMRNINIPGLSDIPVVGELLFSYNPFVYLGLVIAVLASIYLYKTQVGLNVQAIGENPGAADAAGIEVTKWRYINILLSGAICGIGGAYCSMIINSGVWLRDSVAGLGWISVALVIFASWKPVNVIYGSFIFGALRVLKYYVPKNTYAIPTAFFDALPFLITALVLVISSMRKNKGGHIPAHLGMNYFREER